jgi:hypothetical protein
MVRSPANFWLELTAALPHARFEDISEAFSHLMLVKSDEEMAQVRYAARGAEAACRVIVDVTAPGVGEEVVFAEATREMLRGIAARLSRSACYSAACPFCRSFASRSALCLANIACAAAWVMATISWLCAVVQSSDSTRCVFALRKCGTT